MEIAEIWIIKNQFNRRNLPLFTRATLNFALEKRFKKKYGNRHSCKENSRERTYVREADREREEEPFNKAAKAAGMSHDSYAKCKFIDKHATEEDKKKLHKGEASTNQVYNRIKKVREESVSNLESIEVEEEYR